MSHTVWGPPLAADMCRHEPTQHHVVGNMQGGMAGMNCHDGLLSVTVDKI